MTYLVEQMLALHKARQSARTPHEQSVLAAQVAATDRQIDRLVYDLHRLTEVVAEGCTRRKRRQPTAKTSM